MLHPYTASRITHIKHTYVPLLVTCAVGGPSKLGSSSNLTDTPWPPCPWSSPVGRVGIDGQMVIWCVGRGRTARQALCPGTATQRSLTRPRPHKMIIVDSIHQPTSQSTQLTASSPNTRPQHVRTGHRLVDLVQHHEARKDAHGQGHVGDGALVPVGQHRVPPPGVLRPQAEPRHRLALSPILLG